MPLPNLASFARMLQIGNQVPNQQQRLPQGIPVTPFPFGPPPEPEFDVESEISKLYTPQRTMQDMAQQMLQNFPERDTSPSIWRRIGAGLSAIGSENPMATSDQFLNYHHYRALEDFKRKFDPLSKAADDERLANAQELALARQTVSGKQQQQKIEQAEKKQEALERDKERMRANQEDKTKLAWFKTKNPNLKLVTSIKGGNIHVFNPATGELTDTKIDSGTLSDIERMDMQLENNLELIMERGGQARQTQAAGITQRAELDWQPVDVEQPDGTVKSMLFNPKTNQFKEMEVPGKPRITKTPTTPSPSRPGAGGSTELERTRGMMNRAREAALRPEWAKYITFPSATQFKVQPTGRFSGPDAATYKAISDYISGKSTSAPAPSGTVPDTGRGRGGSTPPPLTISREQAIKALQDNKIAATEENIKKAMDPKNWK